MARTPRSFLVALSAVALVLTSGCSGPGETVATTPAVTDTAEQQTTEPETTEPETTATETSDEDTTDDEAPKQDTAQAGPATSTEGATSGAATTEGTSEPESGEPQLATSIVEEEALWTANDLFVGAVGPAAVFWAPGDMAGGMLYGLSAEGDELWSRMIEAPDDIAEVRNGMRVQRGLSSIIVLFAEQSSGEGSVITSEVIDPATGQTNGTFSLTAADGVQLGDQLSLNEVWIVDDSQSSSWVSVDEVTGEMSREGIDAQRPEGLIVTDQVGAPMGDCAGGGTDWTYSYAVSPNGRYAAIPGGIADVLAPAPICIGVEGAEGQIAVPSDEGMAMGTLNDGGTWFLHDGRTDIVREGTMSVEAILDGVAIVASNTGHSAHRIR